jgi:hypothetical protein
MPRLAGPGAPISAVALRSAADRRNLVLSQPRGGAANANAECEDTARQLTDYIQRWRRILLEAADR